MGFLKTLKEDIAEAVDELVMQDLLGEDAEDAAVSRMQTEISDMPEKGHPGKMKSNRADNKRENHADTITKKRKEKHTDTTREIRPDTIEEKNTDRAKQKNKEKNKGKRGERTIEKRTSSRKGKQKQKGQGVLTEYQEPTERQMPLPAKTVRSSLSDFLYEDEFNGDIDAEIDALVADIEARKEEQRRLLLQQEQEEKMTGKVSLDDLKSIDDSKLSIKDLLNQRMPSRKEIEARQKREEERQQMDAFLKQKRITAVEVRDGEEAGKTDVGKTSSEKRKAEEIKNKPEGQNKQERQNMEMPGEQNGEKTFLIPKEITIKGDIHAGTRVIVLGKVQGNLITSDKLVIHGEVLGDMQAQEIFVDETEITANLKANGAVKIGSMAAVNGNIIANAAVIAGAVEGNITASGPVVLTEHAFVKGKIQASLLQKAEGAVVENLE